MTHESWDAGNSGDGRDSSVASVGQSWESGGSWGSVGNGTLGSQVGSSGGLHGGFVHGDHGAIGVAHQLGVEVQGAGVACAVGDRSSSSMSIASVRQSGNSSSSV